MKKRKYNFLNHEIAIPSEGNYCLNDHSTADGILDLIATQGVALGYYIEALQA